ncbi:MAG: spore coat protein U domain-containing protein [Spirochaetota bacterium]
MVISASVFPLFAYTSKTATMKVVGIHETIVVLSTTDLDFGTFTQVSGIVKQDATITVKASIGLPYNITLDGGNSYDGESRNISAGASKIPYKILKPDGLAEWGDADFSGSYPKGTSVSGKGNGMDQTFLAHGELDASKAAGLPNDTYVDFVTVTIWY